jgi:hypothetical protein
MLKVAFLASTETFVVLSLKKGELMNSVFKITLKLEQSIKSL